MDRKKLLHVTVSISEDDVTFLEDIAERNAIRSRSAALAYVLREYRTLRFVKKSLWDGNTNASY